MKKILLISILLMLGCAESGLRPGSELPAVVIREYNFDQDVIRQGQSTGINLVIQNLGDEKGRNIKAKLFRTAGEGLSVKSDNPQPTTNQPVITLNPPDAGTQTPGESREFTWTVEATPLETDKKTAKSYNIGVLVGYDYKSEGFSDLLATTKEQARIDKNQLPTLRSGATKGPVSVNVITPNAILYGSDEKVTVRVDVINGANGIVYSGRSGAGGVAGNDNEMNKIKSIEISIPQDYAKKLNTNIGTDLTNSALTTPNNGDIWCCKPECTDDSEKLDYAWAVDTTDPKYLKLKKDYTNPAFRNYLGSLTLLRGKQKSYVCYFLLDKGNIPEQQIIPIRAIVEYSYSTEDSRILGVEGVK